MPPHTVRSRIVLPSLLLLLGSACLLPGCADDTAQLQQARDAANATLAQAQAADATLRSQAATRPADDPLHAQVAHLETVIAQVQSLLPTINAAIASISSGGAVDPALQQALGAIPYGSIALAIASLVFARMKHVQAGNLSTAQQQTQKAFDQVLAAINPPVPARIPPAAGPDVPLKPAAIT
jgi:hypothetical protein